MEDLAVADVNPFPSPAGLPGLTCVRPQVPLEVEGVVEAFAAIVAQVLLDGAVALAVAVQHALQREAFAADEALEAHLQGETPALQRGGREGGVAHDTDPGRVPALQD